MKITVEYEAQLKTAAGVASEIVELDAPCSLENVIYHVAEKHGDPLKRMLLDPDGNLQKAILIFLKDQQIRWNDAQELCENDVLTILSPISGG